MASSSTVQPREKYDVFISFRGTDTRDSFTSHLHAAFLRAKIDTYIDYRLETGDEIGPALLKAIEGSKIYVIIFSQDYASSTWCLEELAHIMYCWETYKRKVIPIFYRIEPWRVRHQKESYADSFLKHERRLTIRKYRMLKWKSALKRAANLSGLHIPSKSVRDDSDLVEKVVKKILTELNRESSIHSMGLVGVENRIQQILLLLCIVPEDTQIRSVGIWGMGGIGKTTLANIVFHGVSSQFDACCFLANVREESETKSQLYKLRNKLLCKLVGEESETPTIEDFVKRRLKRTKVLVVLDDVDKTSQLEFLAGDQVPFGPGSRIIITTRDMTLLKEMEVLREGNNHDVKVYRVHSLNGNEAMQFFCKNLTMDIRSEPYFSTVSRQVVGYAGGIPLALKTLSSLFRRCKTKGRESFWNKLRTFPNKDLQNVYKVSYDALEENEREIFLDIACFYKGKEISVAKRELDACGLFSDSGIDMLIDMSLISIDEYDCLWMHDVIQEIGWKIVREQCPEDAGKRNRLYTYQDIRHVLENNLGTGTVQKISVNLSHKNIKLTHPDVFTRMHNLILLNFGTIMLQGKMENLSFPDSLKYLNLFFYPLDSLPSKFSPKNLVELHMIRSHHLKTLWNKGQSPENLKRIDLSICRQLIEFPDLSNSKNIESINLKKCENLVEVPSYIWFLQKLVDLNLGYCTKITNFLVSTWKLHSLTSLILRSTSIECLPTNISEMKFLRELDVSGCCNLVYFPEILEPMEFLNILRLGGSSIEQLPESIGNLVSLKLLDLEGCFRLKSVPDCISSLTSLEYLYLERTYIESIPPFTVMGSQLRELNVIECVRLQCLPELPYLLEKLVAYGCTTLKTVSFSMTEFTQGFDQIGICHDSAALRIEEHTFLNCPNLDENARSNIVIDAQLRIIRMAAVLSKFKDLSKIIDLSKSTDISRIKDLSRIGDIFRIQDKEFRKTYSDVSVRFGDRCIDGWFTVSVIVPGNEMSKWFTYQTEGCSIKINPPLHWSNETFLGFALCIAVTFNLKHLMTFELECRYNFKFKNGQSQRSQFTLGKRQEMVRGHERVRGDNLLIWYFPFQLLNDDFRWSTDFYDATQASFEFYGKYTEQCFSVDFIDFNVKRCGVCLLYAQ